MRLITYKGLFVVVLLLLSSCVMDFGAEETCVYDNKKIMDMQVRDDLLWIDFEDCADCEHWWICDGEREEWYFGEENVMPSHLKVGDYVTMKKCEYNGNMYSKGIEARE